MRVKNEKPTTEFGVADGLDFGNEIDESEKVVEEIAKAPEKKKRATTPKAEIDPNRSYSKYYTPKPKTGSKGGTLGRGSVAEKERKVQFSLTCTPAQKQRFIDASEKEHRKLPDFICLAVEEYIEKHNL